MGVMGPPFVAFVGSFDNAGEFSDGQFPHDLLFRPIM
jgi:hypothetical protein